MAKKRKYGTGITARQMRVYDRQDEIVYILRSMANQDNSFEGLLGRPIEQRCGDILESHGFARNTWNRGEVEEAGYEQQSSPWYAAYIICVLQGVRHALENGNAHKAARLAFEVGALLKEARMKFDWERHALDGLKREDRLRNARDRENAKRKAEAEARWNDIRAEARELLDRGHSKKRAAELLKTRHSLRWSVESIRKHI